MGISQKAQSVVLSLEIQVVSSNPSVHLPECHAQHGLLQVNDLQLHLNDNYIFLKDPHLACVKSFSDEELDYVLKKKS